MCNLSSRALRIKLGAQEGPVPLQNQPKKIYHKALIMFLKDCAICQCFPLLSAMQEAQLFALQYANLLHSSFAPVRSGGFFFFLFETSY